MLLLLANHDSLDGGVKNPYDGELKQGKKEGQSSKIKCTASTSDATWHSDNASATVLVEIHFQGTVQVKLMPSLHLMALPKKHGLQQEEYWAPFDVTSGASTKENQKLDPAARARSVRLIPAELLWAPAKSSIWPSQDFSKTVPPGHYSLQVQLELKNGKTISSNEVSITVVK
jgi:hypothetical protein